MIISHVNLTDVGLARKTNQDSIFADVEGDIGVFVVADGMGGHSSGDVASQTLIGSVFKWWHNIGENRQIMSIEELTMGLEAAIFEANVFLNSKFRSEGLVGGTTVVALIVTADKFATLSVGDSRIYRTVADGRMVQITEDDVWQNLPQNRVYPPEQLRADSRFGKLTAAVGAAPQINVKTQICEQEAQERFILCSDGIYKYCRNGELDNMAARGAAEDSDEVTAHLLEQFVRSSGANDNYSLIICTLRR